jgi:hypothetical protein
MTARHAMGAPGCGRLAIRVAVIRAPGGPRRLVWVLCAGPPSPARRGPDRADAEPRGLVIQAARNLAEADAILADWQPHLAVVDMDHDDSTALLGHLSAANRLTRRVTPALG